MPPQVPEADAGSSSNSGRVGSGSEKLPNVFKWITVEPPLFFFAMAAGMVSVGNIKLYMARTCLLGSIIFGNGTTYDESVCSHLDEFEYDTERSHVEYQYSRLSYISSAIQAVPAILFALLAGSWSDVYGRRLLILFPLLGFLIRDVIFLVISQIKSVQPDWLLIEALQDLTGGLPVLMMGTFAHLADFTTERNRTARMAFLEFVFLAGLSIGTSLSGPLFEIGSYAPVYVLAPVLVICGILAIPFFVRKPRIVRDARTGALTNVTYKPEGYEEEVDEEALLSDWTKLKSFFYPSNIARTVRCGFRRREKSKRHLITLVLLTFALLEIVNGVETICDLRFVRDKFHFDDFDDFSGWWRTYYAIYLVWGMLCMSIMVPVLKMIYEVTDPVIVIICAVGSFLRTLVFILGQDRDNLYIGSFLDLFHLAGIVACRSALVSLVDKGEIGAVYGLAAVLQKLTAIAWPVSSLLYLAVKDWNQDIIYCINATIFVVVFAVACYLLWYFRRHKLQVVPKRVKKKKGKKARITDPTAVTDFMK